MASINAAAAATAALIIRAIFLKKLAKPFKLKDLPPPENKSSNALSNSSNALLNLSLKRFQTSRISSVSGGKSGSESGKIASLVVALNQLYQSL